MNCTRCNAPLESGARFCRNCGAPASISDPANSNTPTIASSQPDLPLSAYNAPTSPTKPTQEPQSQQQWILPGPQSPQAPQSSQFQASAPAQQPYYQPTIAVTPGTMQNIAFAGQGPQTFAQGQDMPASRTRRHRGRRLRITLVTLVVLILVLAGAWVFAVRPYVHSLAQGQLDSALSSAVNQIDLSQLSQVPANVPIPLRVTEDNINNFYLPLLHVPSSPVQNMHIQITSNELRFDFTVYGFASDITGRPTLINGKLTITNVSVGGIAGLVISSDEMTNLLNTHLADVQARLHRPIRNVSLLNHELDIILG